MTDQIIQVEAEQLAGANQPYLIDLGQIAVSEWAANAMVGAGGVVRPSSGMETGYYYRNGITAGQSGPSEPAWPTSGTVSDGSLLWTPVIPQEAAGDSIASATWTQQDPPDGTLTISGEINDTLAASAYVGGGTAGFTYVIVVRITMTSGAIYVAQLIVTVL